MPKIGVRIYLDDKEQKARKKTIKYTHTYFLQSSYIVRINIFEDIVYVYKIYDIGPNHIFYHVHWKFCNIIVAQIIF